MRFESEERKRHAGSMLPAVEEGVRQLTMGGGGSGKSLLQELIVDPLATLHLTGRKALASSNAIARQCGGGGQTMHTSMRLRADHSMAPADLVPKSDTLLNLQAEWEQVQSLLLEELSMWPPHWLWALAYRLGHVRKACLPELMVKTCSLHISQPCTT